jgi:hypothetical protein
MEDGREADGHPPFSILHPRPIIPITYLDDTIFGMLIIPYHHKKWRFTYALPEMRLSG